MNRRKTDMENYKYLNSRDVAKHCRQLNWQFNALEMAFIVNDCKNIPLSEKHYRVNPKLCVNGK